MAVELQIDPPFDLTATLESGQAHRWRKDGGWYSGVVRGNFIKMRQSKVGVEFCSQPAPETSVVSILQRYFRLDDDLKSIYQEITQDQRVASMVEQYPGLRVLRQEPWECMVAFICSANSNIPRIHQVMEKMAEHYGEPISMNGEVRHAFPTPVQLVEAGELELRKLGLGFRAPYVDKATRRVVEKSLDLEQLIDLPYDEAKAALMECVGIGPKIADCILVFSLDKMEAFPIDVWIRRALGEWYFPGEKTPTNRVLEQWAHGHFGRYGGYSQQYLFHGRRLAK